MSASKNIKPNTQGADLDAIIIGAGFGGLYMLRKLRDELGLKARIFDKASDVGGTWYWNRYPGAMSDTETYIYCYSFDKDLLRDWKWNTRYITQPQILPYLEHVADRFHLRRDIQFNTYMKAAHFNEMDELWHVTFDNGETLKSKYLVTAVGLLSATNIPQFKGQDSFKKEQLHTGNWPKEGVDFTGKRVGVIGTGSTGVQVITAIASKVKHLTVFQRSPQYSVPAGNGPVSEDEIAKIKQNYDEIWKSVRSSAVAFGFEESTVPAMSVSEEERQRVFEEKWNEGGGFRFMFATFSDIVTDPDANKAACSFIRSKIAQIVKNPETAKKLMPTDYYAKRPLCDSGYYEVYNQDNVDLVDVKANPIQEITEKGIRTAAGEVELDVIIYATGFEGVDGNYIRNDIRGRNGIPIKEKWAPGPTSYLGMTVADFPNMFMILGPNGPFTNLPPSIETQVEWISDLIKETEKRNCTTVEPTQSAEDKWTDICSELAHGTLFPKADSWIFGANIPGKKNSVMFYMGGLKNYRDILEDEAGRNYSGFSFSKEKVA